MRPYMLWLARNYTGKPYTYTGVRRLKDTVLGDWIKYQSDQRFLVEAGRR